MECTKVNCPMQAGTKTDNCSENCPWRTTAKTSDLISRTVAIAEIEDYIEEYSELDPDTGYHSLKWCAMEEAKDVLAMLPAVDAVPMEWIIKWSNKRYRETQRDVSVVDMLAAWQKEREARE